MKLAHPYVLWSLVALAGGFGWWQKTLAKADSGEPPPVVSAETPGAGAGPVSKSPEFVAELGVFSPIGAGIEYGRFPLGKESALGDSTARIVRVDPTIATLRVGSSSLSDHQSHAASAWAGEAKHVAVINTSMYAEDYESSVGFFRVRGVQKNGQWAKQQNSAIALSGKSFRLLNFGCDEVAAARRDWPTLVQSIRMLGCSRENVWAEETRGWSSALIGMDSQGRALFIHTRSPYTMHALVDLLLALPLDLEALHYCEGGPEASLFVRGTEMEEKNVGSFETGFRRDDSNTEEWPLPNVLIAESPE